MSELFGHYTKDKKLDKYQLNRVLNSFSPDLRQYAKVAHGQATTFVSLDHAAYKTVLWNQQGNFVLFQGYPYWQGKPLAQQVPEFYAHYQQHGALVLEQLQGRFRLVIIEEVKGSLLLAVDRFASLPIVYEMVASGLVFGSSGNPFRHLIQTSKQIDLQQIFHYLYFHVVPQPSMVFKQRHKLLPAHYLSYQLQQPNSCQLKKYWQAIYSNDISLGADNHKQVKSLLKQAVDNTVNLDWDTVGCFLSGGVDSSSIVAMASQLAQTEVKTYSIGFDAEGYDEMAFAQVTANHFPTDAKEYYVTPQDVVLVIPEIAKIYDVPFGNASAVPSYYCAKLAQQEGTKLLLGGDGGDELFGGNERYAKQKIFALYHCLPKPLRQWLIEPVAKVLPIQKIKSYIQQANTPMPDRAEAYNLIQRLGATELLTDKFYQQINWQQPLLELKQYYQLFQGLDLANQMMAVDLKMTLADNDLPKVTRMCDLAGIDVGFPFLDNNLVDFSLKLESSQKVKGLRGLRYFFKQAMQDTLPKQVLTKSKHGFGLPFGVWMLEDKNLREITLDSLTDLKQRQIIQTTFIDKLTQQYLVKHPSYYGTLVWVLMMLEQWLQAHQINLEL